MFVKYLLLAVLFWFPAFSFAQADADFDYNAKGLTLNRTHDRTLVGVTRDGSKTWSVYLSPTKKAYFKFSTGKTATATWSQDYKRIICFTGLIKDKPHQKICKRTPELGRGFDWMTINLKTQNGKTVYEKATKGERRGSSQIVYSFKGRQDISQNSYVSDTRKWAGHLIVGRTLKDKEAWFAQFGMDGSVDFVFGSGKRYKGSYRLQDGKICLTFPTGKTANSCRKPTIKNGKILWKDTKSGHSSSEIVFMKKTETEGPRLVKKLSSDRHRMVLLNRHSNTLAAVSQARAGSIVLYDAKARYRIGTVEEFAGDLAYTPDGTKLAGVWRHRAFQIDVASGQIDWVHTRKSGPEFSELAYSPNGQTLIIGDHAGSLTEFAAADGSLGSSHQTGLPDINDIRIAPTGRVLLASDNGLFGAELSQLSAPRQLTPAPLYFVNSRFYDNGAGFVGLTDQGGLVSGRSGQTLADMANTTTVETGAGKTYGFAIHPDGNKVLVSGEHSTRLYALPDLKLLETYPADKIGWSTSLSYLDETGIVAGAVKKKGLYLWAPDFKTAKFATASYSARSAARKRSAAISEAKAKKQAAYKRLKDAAKLAYSKGNCQHYAAIAVNLKPADRKENCAQAAQRRARKAAYDLALKELRCDDAAAIRNEISYGSAKREERCRARVQHAKDKRRFEQAKQDMDCATLGKLGAKFSEPEAGADCTLTTAMQFDNARKMYFAAVKFDSARDRDRAKQLYSEVMNRFPEDDLALDAANRLTAINDLLLIEQRQAESEAALKAAQKSIAKANREKAAAEKRALEAAEKARKAAEREAKAAREAADARAREAQARAEAANRPKRSTACDHVYVGKEFEARGGFLGLKQHYIVVGVSSRAKLATIRSKYSDYRQEVSCYDIP